MPTSQFVHTLAADAELKVPGRQLLHVLDAGAELNLPAPQFVHAASLILSSKAGATFDSKPLPWGNRAVTLWMF